MAVVETRREGAAFWIVLNRPQKLNAVSREVLLALRGAIAAAEADPETRLIVLSGAGERAFAAGADLSEMGALDETGVRDLISQGQGVTTALERSPLPSLALVNGFALGGGCELALACDFIIAAESALFGLPEVELGIIPGWGGTQRLERRVGFGTARAIVIGGKRLKAQEALDAGLCDEVHPAEALAEVAAEWATRIARRDREAVASARRALYFQTDAVREEGLRREAQLFLDLVVPLERRQYLSRFITRSSSS